MKKFFIKISLFIPVIFLVGGVNYVVDPGNLFKSAEYEKGLAKILLGGGNAANIADDFNDPLFLKYYINGQREKKEVIVLGSSRSMQIKKELFPGKSFFNSSVPAARIEHYLAIYGLFYKRKLLPSIIILGLDPWILNRSSYQTRWKSISQYYNLTLERMNSKSRNINLSKYEDLNSKSLDWSKYKELFSFSYFQSSIERLFEIIADPAKIKKGQYYETIKTEADVPIKLSDGSYSYDEKFRTISVPEVRQMVVVFANKKPTYLSDFTRLDKDYIKQLEAFVDLLRHDGIEVVFFLSPYHPYVYEYMMRSDDYSIVQEVQKYFENLAVRKHIKLYGSYNPKDIPLWEADFYDGMHPKLSAVKKIFERFLESEKGT